MIETVKRTLGSLFGVGFAGLVVFMAAGVVEVLTGHGEDAVPSAWLIEVGASFVSVVVGGVGYFVTDLIWS